MNLVRFPLIMFSTANFLRGFNGGFQDILETWNTGAAKTTFLALTVVSLDSNFASDFEFLKVTNVSCKYKLVRI